MNAKPSRESTASKMGLTSMRHTDIAVDDKGAINKWACSVQIYINPYPDRDNWNHRIVNSFLMGHRFADPSHSLDYLD